MKDDHIKCDESSPSTSLRLQTPIGKLLIVFAVTAVVFAVSYSFIGRIAIRDFNAFSPYSGATAIAALNRLIFLTTPAAALCTAFGTAFVRFRRGMMPILVGIAGTCGIIDAVVFLISEIPKYRSEVFATLMPIGMAALPYWLAQWMTRTSRRPPLER